MSGGSRGVLGLGWTELDWEGIAVAEAETDFDAELGRLIREARQRLESLARAGVTTLPRAAEIAVVPRRARPEPPVEEESPSVQPEPTPEISSPPPTSPSSPPPTPPVVEPTRSRPAPPRPRAAEPAPASVPAPTLFGQSGFDAPPVPPEERDGLLRELAEEVAGCLKCPILASSRTQTVFADGSPTARLMFIGEAPGADEDRSGVPFVGPAGQLLTDMITKGMGLKREEVYIANVVKCRPPNNRNPLPEEASNCLPYLERQIEIVRPEYICLLGAVATSSLLNTALGVGRLRGKWHRIRGIPTIATYHPSYLLRRPAAKKEAWADLQMLMRAMGIPIPKRKG